MSAAQNSPNVTNDHDEEFVVPHMDISCMQNSYAYQRILEEPWTYIHNWDSLTVSLQQTVMQSFMQELQEIKSGIAQNERVFVGESGDGSSEPPAVPSESPTDQASLPSNSSEDQATSSGDKK